MNQKRLTQAAGVLAGAAVLAACFFLIRRPYRRSPISRSDFLLNTFVTVTLYDTDDEELLTQCMALCREIRKPIQQDYRGQRDL